MPSKCLMSTGITSATYWDGASCHECLVFVTGIQYNIVTTDFQSFFCLRDIKMGALTFSSDPIIIGMLLWFVMDSWIHLCLSKVAHHFLCRKRGEWWRMPNKSRKNECFHWSWFISHFIVIGDVHSNYALIQRFGGIVSEAVLCSYSDHIHGMLEEEHPPCVCKQYIHHTQTDDGNATAFGSWYVSLYLSHELLSLRTMI